MSNNRRNFLKQTALLSFGAITSSVLGTEGSQQLIALESQLEVANASSVNFSLPALPYSPDALEPFIDKTTMEIHHGKHHNAYVDNLNKALATKNNQLKLEGLLVTISSYEKTVRNNAGGHYNHSLFWELMRPTTGSSNMPEGKILEALNNSFGSFESFKTQFTECALKRFGSGWAWLYAEGRQLKIGSTPNQDNPLMNDAEIKGAPLLALDVWEHAYYLKYQNKRADYITNWWNVVNWNKVTALFSNL